MGKIRNRPHHYRKLWHLQCLNILFKKKHLRCDPGVRMRHIAIPCANMMAITMAHYPDEIGYIWHTFWSHHGLETLVDVFLQPYLLAMLVLLVLIPPTVLASLSLNFCSYHWKTMSQYLKPNKLSQIKRNQEKVSYD